MNWRGTESEEILYVVNLTFESRFVLSVYQEYTTLSSYAVHHHLLLS